MNHSVFWPNISPEGGDKPTGELAQVIDEHFGGFDKFRAHFETNALGVQGSGWSVLTWDMVSQRPFIIQHFDHQGNVPICMVPLLMLDMWEHAYYLQYKNDKATFVQQCRGHRRPGPWGRGGRARALLTSFDTHEELGAGALLVADLALGLLSEATGNDLDVSVGELNLRLLARERG